MEWYTTKEAANLLGVTPGRVRQLAAKHRDNTALISQNANGNLISQKLIGQHLKTVNANASPNAETIENLEEGVHMAANGNMVQVFSFQDYEAFKEALIERRQLTLALTQEREQRAFLEKQIERKDDLLKNSISAVQKSLDNIHQGLTNIERDQTLKYIKESSTITAE
jgi:DNA-binding transcriptional MerR regulator